VEKLEAKENKNGEHVMWKCENDLTIH
jgi:hypothetical protein